MRKNFTIVSLFSYPVRKLISEDSEQVSPISSLARTGSYGHCYLQERLGKEVLDFLAPVVNIGEGSRGLR